MITLSVKMTFFIPQAHSLKDKRMIAKSLIDKIRRKYNAAVAEVDTQDVHQILTIGIAVVSGQYSHARNMLDGIIRYAEENAEADLTSVGEEG